MISAFTGTVRGIVFYALVCVIGCIVVIYMLRRDRNSIGLPAAYLFLLLLAHLPGAFVHIVGDSAMGESAVSLTPSIYTEIGLEFTATGVVCFAVGVWLARRAIRGIVMPRVAYRPSFWHFCLIGGWFFYYALITPFRSVPSLGAAVHEGAGIWMLGVMLALAYAFERRDRGAILLWCGVLIACPIFNFVMGGFLSYGVRATIIVLGMLTVTVRKWSRLTVVISVMTIVGTSLFSQYMAHRTDIRAVLWNDEAGYLQRIEAVWPIVEDFHLLDPTDPDTLNALDERLNQNRFIGLAAERIRLQATDYLYGRTVGDAFIALIPRAIWPDKPVTAGSGDIVANATGLYLGRDTSWGVGNVMEFQINFGWSGVIVGFLALGMVIGALDRKVAIAIAMGDLRKTTLLFLPCVACIQPGGSLVEVMSGASAALVAALWWRWAWTHWNARQRANHLRGQTLVRRADSLL